MPPVKTQQEIEAVETLFLQAAHETIESLRTATPASLFTEVVATLHLVERGGQVLLTHGTGNDVSVVLRHRREEDLGPDGQSMGTGPNLLVTSLLARDTLPEPPVTPEQWRAICCVQEFLCLQNWVVDGPVGARELRASTRTVTQGLNTDRFFVLSREEHGVEQGKNLESNSLFLLFLAEFCRCFGIPYRALPSLSVALLELNQHARNCN